MWSYRECVGGSGGTVSLPAHLKNITAADIEKWNSGGAANVLLFNNIVVEPASWVADETYEEFGYKADIPCTGVTSDFFSMVTFDVAEATSGNYAPISLSGSDIVTIYAVEQPEEAITLLSIICSKGA